MEGHASFMLFSVILFSKNILLSGCAAIDGSIAAGCRLIVVVDVDARRLDALLHITEFPTYGKADRPDFVAEICILDCIGRAHVTLEELPACQEIAGAQRDMQTLVFQEILTHAQSVIVPAAGPSLQIDHM